MPRKFWRWGLLGLALLGAVVAGRDLRLTAMDRYLATQRYESVYYLPPPEWLPLLSLGYREAAADFVWTKALVYFGEETFRRGELDHVFRYGDALTALDPNFLAAYRWTALVATYNTRGATLEDMWKAVEYLERGVARFPHDGRLAWDLGSLLSFEIVPRLNDPDEKRKVRARGTEHLVVASRLGAAPPWMALTNASSLEKLGQLDQAVRYLEEMYALVQDPVTRERIAHRLTSLRSAAYAEALQRSVEDLESTRARDYPYLPLDFFLLVGARPVVDEARLLRSGFLPDDGSAALDSAE